MKHEKIIWYAIALQLITGVSLLLHGEALNTAALSPFYQYASPTGVGLTHIGAASLAVYALRSDKKYPQAVPWLLVPQQLLLLMSGVIALTLSVQGHYADGVVRPFFFIFTDQLPAMLLAVFYTATIILTLRNRWRSNLQP